MVSSSRTADVITDKIRTNFFSDTSNRLVLLAVMRWLVDHRDEEMAVPSDDRPSIYVHAKCTSVKDLDRPCVSADAQGRLVRLLGNSEKTVFTANHKKSDTKGVARGATVVDLGDLAGFPYALWVLDALLYGWSDAKIRKSARRADGALQVFWHAFNLRRMLNISNQHNYVGVTAAEAKAVGESGWKGGLFDVFNMYGPEWKSLHGRKMDTLFGGVVLNPEHPLEQVTLAGDFNRARTKTPLLDIDAK